MSESSLSSLDVCLLWSLTSDRGEQSLGLSLGDSRGDTAFTGMKLHTCVLWRCFLGRLPVENTVLSSLVKISLLITLSHILGVVLIQIEVGNMQAFFGRFSAVKPKSSFQNLEFFRKFLEFF